MMQKIQKFGGAMYTPAILFAFSGIVVGLGTLFTTEAIFGSLAVAGNPWYDCWNVLLQGGWTLFNQMPLLFCVALPITLATHQQARACMEALAAYLTFNYFVNTILAQWGGVFGVDFSVEAASGTGLATIASIKTLDMGMMGALIISGITVMLHNKFFDTELPDWLGVFGGSVRGGHKVVFRLVVDRETVELLSGGGDFLSGAARGLDGGGNVRRSHGGANG